MGSNYPLIVCYFINLLFYSHFQRSFFIKGEERGNKNSPKFYVFVTGVSASFITNVVAQKVAVVVVVVVVWC